MLTPKHTHRLTRPTYRRSTPAAIKLALSLIAFCLLAGAQTAPAQPRRAARAPAPRVAVIPEETMLRIMRAEDERRWDADDLGALLTDRSAAVRQRAALAAGRIGDERAVAPLIGVLQTDKDMGVRASAAFALGEVESVQAVDALVAAVRTNPMPGVRARAVEALGKIAATLPQSEAARRQTIGGVILGALAAERRAGAAAAGGSSANLELVLLGLTAAIRAQPTGAGAVVAQFLNVPNARVRADAANALARLRAQDGNEQLRRQLVADADASARANAARALGVAEDKAAFDALVKSALEDADARVRISAIRALALLADVRAAEPLRKRTEALLVAYRAARAANAAHPAELNELLELATTLGRLLANTTDERTLNLLRELRTTEHWSAPELEVAAAHIAPTQYLHEAPFKNLFLRVTDNKLTWQAVAAVAKGLGELAGVTSEQIGNSASTVQADAQLALRALLQDEATPALAGPDVLRAVAAYKPTDISVLARAQLTAPDVIVRATAAELLRDQPPDTDTTRALAAALPVALHDELNDAALAILDALASQRNPDALAAIKTTLDAPDYLLRRRAATLLRAAHVAGAAEAADQTVATRNRLADYRRALARTNKRVLATVTTDKGAFVIELLPAAAPLTVDNFVELARRGFFNDLAVHRVVPNFVIQGGDPRGDGNGGPGYQIRCEINEERYARGAVGMALSGKDTGGSQWFVTHSPQPHLDGGYTVFGRVTQGMEVVDRIARGDRIRGVVVTETPLR